MGPQRDLIDGACVTYVLCTTARPAQVRKLGWGSVYLVLYNKLLEIELQV